MVMQVYEFDYLKGKGITRDATPAEIAARQAEEAAYAARMLIPVSPIVTVGDELEALKSEIQTLKEGMAVPAVDVLDEMKAQIRQLQEDVAARDEGKWQTQG